MTQTQLPYGQTQAQRDAHLALANEIRAARSRLKFQLKHGEVDPTSMIENPPPPLRNMRVDAFLDALPRVGPMRVQRILTRALVSPRKTLASLTERQRRALLDELAP